MALWSRFRAAALSVCRSLPFIRKEMLTIGVAKELVRRAQAATV
ncbi:hypothetical protein [Microvirga calopogonii]|nr:hypothetical protein [Microvirga calopogonii]